MATYVLGDIQGCYDELRCLLEAIPFKADRDRLWFVGDLINRGPKSLATLRFVKDLEQQALTVLGNHDLHLLAIYFGGHRVLKGDTFDDILNAPDCEQLCHWLRHLPLLVESDAAVMTHAGIPHIWDLPLARQLAREVEDTIQNADYHSFFRLMYGNEPSLWNSQLVGMDRLRAITNYFTRLRFIRQDGDMDFTAKGTLDDTPAGYQPWFQFELPIKKTLYFGHWAAIDGYTGRTDVLATDTGCVWGRGLTAIRLADRQRFVWLENQLVKPA